MGNDDDDEKALNLFSSTYFSFSFIHSYDGVYHEEKNANHLSCYTLTYTYSQKRK